MTIPFTKAHGARNDFLLTWRDGLPDDPSDLGAAAIAICDRRTGVGAEVLADIAECLRDQSRVGRRNRVESVCGAHDRPQTLGLVLGQPDAEVPLGREAEVARALFPRRAAVGED